MVKIGTTIMAFPNNELPEYAKEFDIIEWTDRQLRENNFPTLDNVTSLTSVIDSSRVNESLSLFDNTDYVLAYLASTFKASVELGLTSWSLTIPKMRESDEPISDEDGKMFFKALSNVLHHAIEYFDLDVKKFTIYVPPMTHSRKWLTSMEEVIAMCEYTSTFTNEIVFKPLLPVRWLLQNKYSHQDIIDIVKQYPIERVYIALKVPTKRWSNNPESQRMKKLIKGIIQHTHKDVEDVEIIYEHRVRYRRDNSTRKFLQDMKEIIE